MRVQLRRADTNGTLDFGQGYGLLLVPMDSAARFPVNVEFGGTGRQEELYEERPLYTSFIKARVTGAQANSQWLTYLAESDKEIVGSLNHPGQMVRIASAIHAGAIDASTTTQSRYLTSAGTLSATRELFDVRRFSEVFVTIQAFELAPAGGATPTAKLKAEAWPGPTGVSGFESQKFDVLTAGSSGDLVPDGGASLSWLQVGSCLSPVTNTLNATVSRRVPYIAPYLEVTANEVDFGAGVQLELWGIL